MIKLTKRVKKINVKIKERWSHLDNLTVYLKSLRLRSDDERLSDMAKKLGVSASYLSTVENQKRRMNDKLFQKIVEVYELNEKEEKKLDLLRILASKEFNVSLDEMEDEKKETVVKFLSSVDDLSKEDVEKINLLLKNKK